MKSAREGREREREIEVNFFVAVGPSVGRCVCLSVNLSV